MNPKKKDIKSPQKVDEPDCQLNYFEFTLKTHLEYLNNLISSTGRIIEKIENHRHTVHQNHKRVYLNLYQSLCEHHKPLMITILKIENHSIERKLQNEPA